MIDYYIKAQTTAIHPMNDEEKQNNPLILMAQLATQDPKDTAKNGDSSVQNHKMAIASLLSPSAINDDNNSVVAMTSFQGLSKDSNKNSHYRQYIIDDIEASQHRKQNLVSLPRLSEAIRSSKFPTNFPPANRHQFQHSELEIYGNRSCEHSNSDNYTHISNAPNSRIIIISKGNYQNDWGKAAGGNFANQTIHHPYHTGHGLMQSRSNFTDSQSQILHDDSTTMNQKSVFRFSGNQLNGKLPQLNSTTPHVGSSGTNGGNLQFIESDKKKKGDQILSQKSYQKKPYICDICGSSFARPSSLQTHMRTHTGERPFVCPYPGCGKAFSIKNNQIRHYRLHTREITKRSLLVSDETTTENL